MSNKAIHYLVGGVQLQAPAVQKTNQTSATFDRELSGGQGAPYEALELLLDIGAYTDGAHAWQINDSPNGTTWTPAPAVNLIGAGSGAGGFVAVNSAAGQNTIQRCAYVGANRYVQVVSTETGANGLLYGVIAVPGFPRNLPTVVSGQ